MPEGLLGLFWKVPEGSGRLRKPPEGIIGSFWKILEASGRFSRTSQKVPEGFLGSFRKRVDFSLHGGFSIPRWRERAAERKEKGKGWKEDR